MSPLMSMYGRYVAEICECCTIDLSAPISNTIVTRTLDCNQAHTRWKGEMEMTDALNFAREETACLDSRL